MFLIKEESKKNKYGNLTSLWQRRSLLAVREREKESRSKGTGKMGFDHPFLGWPKTRSWPGKERGPKETPGAS
jgi:hypothetical protein